MENSINYATAFVPGEDVDNVWLFSMLTTEKKNLFMLRRIRNEAT